MSRETDVHFSAGLFLESRFLRWRFRDRRGRAHGRASVERPVNFQTSRRAVAKRPQGRSGRLIHRVAACAKMEVDPVIVHQAELGRMLLAALSSIIVSN